MARWIQTMTTHYENKGYTKVEKDLLTVLQFIKDFTD